MSELANDPGSTPATLSARAARAHEPGRGTLANRCPGKDEEYFGFKRENRAMAATGTLPISFGNALAPGPRHFSMQKEGAWSNAPSFLHFIKFPEPVTAPW
ncbi:hypothetical protein [Ensifer adhaerens]|uniref:hypothetical protein n=1 Tax=Ensifer adhaerens TaxID=106592 RepID=UPI000FD7B950|nr:hypothetical protein [Ensifer adhaerens]MDF8356816.1 hypothetical protein [Ensifer adhaerens]THA57774.1 hypothetical protein E5176_33135 [Ensifer adhaerens]